MLLNFRFWIIDNIANTYWIMSESKLVRRTGYMVGWLSWVWNKKSVFYFPTFLFILPFIKCHLFKDADSSIFKLFTSFYIFYIFFSSFYIFLHLFTSFYTFYRFLHLFTTFFKSVYIFLHLFHIFTSIYIFLHLFKSF